MASCDVKPVSLLNVSLDFSKTYSDCCGSHSSFSITSSIYFQTVKVSSSLILNETKGPIISDRGGSHNCPGSSNAEHLIFFVNF